MEKNAIHRIWPLGFQWETKDPFLFCAHHEDFYPRGNSQFGPDVSLAGRNLGMDFQVKDGFRMYHGENVPGFPGHPHRGFETVTIVEKGFVDHSDSFGSAGRYGMGDVQWMTAGKGMQHSEMFPLLDSENDNPLVLFQIWLNLPSNKKMVDPFYKMLWSKDIPIITEKSESGASTKIKLIAGSRNGIQAVEPAPNSWAADPENLVNIWIIEIEKDGTLQIPATTTGISRTLYFYKGDGLALNGLKIPMYQGIDLDSTSDIQLQSSKENIGLLFLQGKPIGEPVVQYGPFVMNSPEEIQQAFSDYKRTQFGGWPWNTHEPIHGGTTKKFAKYLDGKEEYPE